MNEIRWEKPRILSVVVDNPSWIISYAQRLTNELNLEGDNAKFCENHQQIREGTAAFYLGCLRITPPEVLKRNKYNVVVHQSDLPRGRGFSPLTWQILEGKNEIPVSVLEAIDEVDAGPIYYKDVMRFEGHELIDELRRVSAETSIRLCKKFLNSAEPPAASEQRGEPHFYPKRKAVDSVLDVSKSIGEQFDLLRTVDNEKYPAWFSFRGKKYKISIEKMPD